MRSNPPVERFAGTVVVDGSISVVFPYTDLRAMGVSWLLWVANDGPAPIQVRWRPSPDGVAPDVESGEWFDVPVGQSAMLHRERELRRFWSIEAWCPSAGPSAVRYGVVIHIEE